MFAENILSVILLIASGLQFYRNVSKVFSKILYTENTMEGKLKTFRNFSK